MEKFPITNKGFEKLETELKLLNQLKDLMLLKQ